MNHRFLLATLLLFVQIQTIQAQLIGGRHVAQFTNLPPSARVTALGGAAIAVRDADVNLAYGNPGSLSEDMHGRLAFGYNFYFSGASYGSFAYAHHLQKAGITLGGGIQFISYGDQVQTDVFGNETGSFTSGEKAFYLQASRQFYERLRGGVQLKYLFSSLGPYSSNALAADIGFLYADTSQQFAVGFVMKNMGAQLDAFAGTEKEPIPFEMQLGVSKRLKHLPFRISVICHHLDRWNLLYDDPALDDTNILGETITRSDFAKFTDNFFRHFIFNGEFLLGKKENLLLRFGYNHLRRKELSVENLRSLAGFSGGVGIRISKFYLDYGFATYHLAGATNHLSISTQLQSFLRNF